MNHCTKARCWLILFLLAVAGCTQSSEEPARKKTAANGEKRDNSLEIAVKILHDAENTANYREALERVNSHLRKSKIALPIAAVDQAVLTQKYGLNPEDLKYLADPAFRPLDANYLAGCYLLRDAARAIEQPSAGPLQQARLVVEWVNRQVLLTEYSPTLYPAPFVLERGFGNAWERGLVCVELLRQLGRDSAIVTAGNAVHLGVAIPEKDGAAMHLFDLRLGQAVADGMKIKTLAELHKGEAKDTAQVYAAVALPALAPRMKHLHDELARRDHVMLAVKPVELLSRLETAADSPVQVWSNAVQPGGAPKGSPLLAWRNTIAEPLHGSDQTRQLLGLNRFPWIHIRDVYTTLRLVEPDFNAQAHHRLRSATQLTFERFVSSPREFMLRGEYDRIHRRLEGIRSALSDLESVRIQGGEFIERVGEWRRRVNDAYVTLLQQPENSSQAQQARSNLERLWSEDQYFVSLLTKDGVPRAPQEGGDFREVVLPKGILTFIVLSATHESLENQTSRLFAQMWQEKAEKAQAVADALAAEDQKNPALVRAREKARAAWMNARGNWTRYLDRFYFTSGTLQNRLTIIANRAQQQDVGTAAVWSQHLLDHVLEAAHAKLCLARAQQQLGEDTAAKHHLTRLIEDLDALEKNRQLIETFEQAAAAAPPELTALFRGIAREFTAAGAVHWLREQARSGF